MILHLLKSSYQRVRKALSKTRGQIGEKICTLFQGKIDEEALEKLEELFYEADLGIKSASELTEKARKIMRQNLELSSEQLLQEIKNEVKELLLPHSYDFNEASVGPTVILIVGVNGNGKTTSVAKLAKKFQDEGKTVLIAAADTFRAAAMEQLEIWAKRLHIEVIKGPPKKDPAAVAFEALSYASKNGIDIVLIDTAGRLHTKKDLMQELAKIRRICQKVCPNSPHETLFVVDATTGQNAIDQAKIFHHYTPLSGILLTKLDGTAKGGIVLHLQKELQIPVKFIGTGENLEDLEPFNPEEFALALFE